MERLRADADYHKQVAGDCDCRPEDTVNWEHRLTCLEAADRIEALEAAARFLLDRLDEYEPDADDDGTDFNGHVVPARARLRAAIAPEQDK